MQARSLPPVGKKPKKGSRKTSHEDKILSIAEDDLEEGHRFYESQADGLGSYFLDTLYSDIDSLAYFAGMHRIVLDYHRLLSKRFPFAVYYRVADDVVTVFAVLDCRRNPSWIRKKLSK